MTDLTRDLEAQSRWTEAIRWQLPEAIDFGREVVDRQEPEASALLWRSVASSGRRLSLRAA